MGENESAARAVENFEDLKAVVIKISEKLDELSCSDFKERLDSYEFSEDD